MSDDNATKDVAENDDKQDGLAKTEQFQQMDIADMAKSLKGLEEGIEVTGEYYKFVEGEEIRCYLVGMTKIASKNKESGDDQGKVPAVRLLFADETFKVCASTMLVGVLSEFPIPSPVKIIKTGTETSPAGDYDVFKVYPLG